MVYCHVAVLVASLDEDIILMLMLPRHLDVFYLYFPKAYILEVAEELETWNPWLWIH